MKLYQLVFVLTISLFLVNNTPLKEDVLIDKNNLISINQEDFSFIKQAFEDELELKTSPEYHRIKIETAFEGPSYAGYIPPDPQIAVGPNHVAAMVNSEIRIYDKTGLLILRKTLNEFFQFPSADRVGDPKIFFDLQSNRWFATATNFGGGIVKLAVSKTEDPTQGWFIYSVSEPGYCTDYPLLGMSDDKVAISANIFGNPNCQGGFLRWRLWVLDKNALIEGIQITWSTHSPSYFTVYPAKSLTSTSTLYLVSTLSRGSNVYLFTVTGNPSNNNVQISVTSLSIQYIDFPPKAEQPGTTSLLDTGDARVQDATFYQNKIWFSLNYGCFPPGDNTERSCLGIFSLDLASMTINKLVISEKGKYYFYPALSLDSKGNVVIVYGFSSSIDYPSIAVTAIPSSNPSMWLDSVILKRGSSYTTLGTGSRVRYGDYFGAAIDPLDKNRVWVIGEYIPTTNIWSTYIGSIRILSQVTIAVNYTVIGDQGYSPPVFSYYSNGILHQTPLGDGTNYFLIDEETEWRISEILGGSTSYMRWITNNATVGIATKSASLRFVYYHQYFVTFDYKTSDNTFGGAPKVSFVAFGMPNSRFLPASIWIDSNTQWSIEQSLPNSNNYERWITQNTTMGIVHGPASLRFVYYHQYFVTFTTNILENNFRPWIAYYQLNVLLNKSLPIADWIDANSVAKFAKILFGADKRERWIVQENELLINSPATFTIEYIRQYLVNLSFSTINGESPTSPKAKYTSLRVALEKNLPFSDWVDANTYIDITNPLPTSNSKERWYTLNFTNILVNRPLDLRFVYYHQYFVTFVLNEKGITPSIIYSQFNSQVKKNLPIADWIDANSVAVLLDRLIQVSDKERWITYNATNFLIKSSAIFNIVYTRQFYIEIVTEPPEGGNVNLSSNWHDFGSEIMIRATPNEGWKFMYWEGSYSSTNNTVRLIVKEPALLRAVFFLSVSLESSEGITIEYKYQEMSNELKPSSNVTIYLPKNSQIILKAKPSLFYDFRGWSGSISSNEETLTFTVTKPINLRTSSEINYTLIILIAVATLAVIVAFIYLFRRLKK